MVQSINVPSKLVKQQLDRLVDPSYSIGQSFRYGEWVTKETARRALGRAVTDLIGYEFEMEGTGLNDFRPPNGFRKVADGSLRGEACEVVFTHPAANLEQATQRINTLFEQLQLQNVELNQSSRTSVHIHFNFNNSHFVQFINFAVIWYIYEEFLVKWCGEDREGNNFCLRAIDAYWTIQNLIEAIRVGQPWLYSNNERRYAAFNYHALSKFGSVEIRSMGGKADLQKQILWLNILNAMYTYAHKEDITPDQIVGMMSGYGGYDLLTSVIGVREEDINQVLADLDLTRHEMDEFCYRGVRLSQDIAFCRDWKPLNNKQEEKAVLPNPAAEEPFFFDDLEEVRNAGQLVAGQRLEQIDEELINQWVRNLNRLAEGINQENEDN